MRTSIAIGALPLFALGFTGPTGANPQTDVQIRDWYKKQEAAIPALVARLKREGKSAEARARAAFQVRHDARLKSRQFMREAGRPEEVALLEGRDLSKYGNKDGPTFEYLGQKALAESKKKGPDDELYESIVAGSQRTNPWG